MALGKSGSVPLPPSKWLLLWAVPSRLERCFTFVTLVCGQALTSGRGGRARAVCTWPPGEQRGLEARRCGADRPGMGTPSSPAVPCQPCRAGCFVTSHTALGKRTHLGAGGGERALFLALFELVERETDSKGPGSCFFRVWLSKGRPDPLAAVLSHSPPDPCRLCQQERPSGAPVPCGESRISRLSEGGEGSLRTLLSFPRALTRATAGQRYTADWCQGLPILSQDCESGCTLDYPRLKRQNKKPPHVTKRC